MKALVNNIALGTMKTVLRRVFVFLTSGTRTPAVSAERLPSRALQDYVGGDYQKTGEEFFRYFIELCELKPDEKVLDVGSGSGRMAVPPTRYLSSKGCYEGFDISVAGVRWCQENITPRFPNFTFQLADLHNASYNPRGRYHASEFQFPYEDQAFDFVFLTSVFTHMLPNDMEHYFSEITRVLKPGGRCLITFFLLNDDSTMLINKKMGTYNFEYQMEGYRTVNKTNQEDAVAYDEMFIRGLYEKHGLEVSEPIHYGSWCGRKDFLSFQDMVVANKAMES